MEKKYMTILILLLSIFTTYAYQKEKCIYKDTLIEVWSTYDFNDKIKDQINIIKKMLAWSAGNLTINNRQKQIFKLKMDDQKNLYIGNNSELTFGCEFVENMMNVGVERQATQSEYDFFYENKQICPSYLKINEKKAIEIANKFLDSLFHEYKILHQRENFKSFKVSYGPDCYVIDFWCDNYNDIKDIRKINMHIISISGEVRRFYSRNLLSPYDLNYKPKVSKKQVLEMINDLFSQLGTKIQYDLYLTQSGRSKNRWAWHLYGVKENSKQKIKDGIIIDSETGEVLMNTFGPDKK